MDRFSPKDIKILLSNLCCSKCKNEFDIDSIEILETHKDIFICNLKCQKCSKDFGKIILKYNTKAKTHNPLEVIDGPEPISYDDVIDAHRFLKNKSAGFGKL